MYLYDTNNMTGADCGTRVVVEIKYFCTKNVVIHTEIEFTIGLFNNSDGVKIYE